MLIIFSDYGRQDDIKYTLLPGQLRLEIKASVGEDVKELESYLQVRGGDSFSWRPNCCDTPGV